MKPALFGIPSVRAEDGFPSECPGASERVYIDEKAIVHAVELDGLSAWRVDDARMPDRCRRMTADLIEAIEGPDFLVDSGRRRGGDTANQDYCSCDESHKFQEVCYRFTLRVTSDSLPVGFMKRLICSTAVLIALFLAFAAMSAVGKRTRTVGLRSIASRSHDLDTSRHFYGGLMCFRAALRVVNDHAAVSSTVY